MEPVIDAAGVQEFRQLAQGFLDIFTEPNQSGGSYVNAANRWTLLSLALSIQAKDILETGYNTGLTTVALALTGANVVGVDNCYEQPAVEELAQARLANFTNVRLVQEDALLFLVREPSESYDLIFVDDCHWPSYTAHECVEIIRLLRPGGLAVFHDTFYAELWDVIMDVFPVAWQRLNLPSWQPNEGTYSGIATMAGRDLGLGIVRRPWEQPVHARSLAECLEISEGKGGRQKPTIEMALQNEFTTESRIWRGEESSYLIGIYCSLLRARNRSMPVTDVIMRNMEETLRTWGKYCSSCASFVGHERYHGKEDA